MNVNTGHIVSNDFWNSMPTAEKPDYSEVPPHLNRAARRKLAGRNEAKVALNSGGKLSRWARKQKMWENEIGMDFVKLIQGSMPGACTTTAGEHSTTEAITLAKIIEMKQKLYAMPAAPVSPKLLRMPWPIKQARAHHTRRVNKKWAKRYGKTIDVSVDKGQCYQFADFLTGAPVVAAYPKSFERLKVVYPGTF